MEYKLLPINEVELDLENPRIKQYLQIYKEITSETIALALSGSNGTDSTTKYKALKDSIKKNNGIFTPIIVNHITRENKYIVIEGNTRLCFYKEFYKKEPIETWSRIMSIVYEDMDDDQIHAIRLQAHMVGARDWDPFSKAKYLSYLYYDEKKSMEYLKDFCGGQESAIRNLMDAYKDMTESYIPLTKEKGKEFDPQDFSKYVELQKSGNKNALAVHSYDLDDFSTWVIEGNIDKAEAVRKLSNVLDDPIAKDVFVKENLTEAIKCLAIQESKGRRLSKTNMYDLAKELSLKLRQISLPESQSLKNDIKYRERKEILVDLGYDLKNVLDFIGEEIDE